MARVNYPSSSPYSGTAQSSWFIGHYQHRKISPHHADRVITIEPRYEHRPDLLAYDLYGNADYWWVFISRNIGRVRDPWDFDVGLRIIVPTAAHLKASLG